jgi:hypothetical protein
VSVAGSSRAPKDRETKLSLMRKNSTVIFGILAGAVLVMLFVAALSGRGMGGIGRMMGGGMMGSGMNGMFFLLLFWLLVTSLLVTLTVFLVTQSQKR